MFCPKCNKEIPHDHNLCGYCGNPIREKCPECGEMEWIGRPVCETKFNKISKAKEDAFSMSFKKYRRIFSVKLWLWGLGGLLLGIIGAVKIQDTILWKDATDDTRLAMVLAVLVVWFLLGVTSLNPTFDWKRNEEKFWRENPNFKGDWDKWQEWLSKEETVKK